MGGCRRGATEASFAAFRMGSAPLRAEVCNFGKLAGNNVPVYKILSQVDPTSLSSSQLGMRKQLGKNSSKVYL